MKKKPDAASGNPGSRPTFREGWKISLFFARQIVDFGDVVVIVIYEIVITDRGYRHLFPVESGEHGVGGRGGCGTLAAIVLVIAALGQRRNS